MPSTPSRGRKRDSDQPHSYREFINRIVRNTKSVDPAQLLEAGWDQAPLDGLEQALAARFQSMEVRNVFKPGDLVCWKPGLQNRRYPSANKAAVVMKVLDQPIYDNKRSSGSTYFREPLDLLLGLFVDEGESRGEFLCWYFDSNRFEPWIRTRALPDDRYAAGEQQDSDEDV